MWNVTNFNMLLYKKDNVRTVDYQVMNQGVTPSINSSNIEDQIRSIIERKGTAGWVRVGKCEKEYVNSNRDENAGTRRTRFYRWLMKVEKRKAPDFQVLKFPNNLSYIGLANSNPKKLDALMAEDKEVAEELNFSDTFYSSAFRKLDEVCSLANGNRTRYASPDKALLELVSFIATLPRDLKEKIRPLQDEAIDSVTRHGKMPLEPRYYGGLVGILCEEDSVPDREFLKDCYTWVLKLVNEVSSLLHESRGDLTLFGVNQSDDK